MIDIAFYIKSDSSDYKNLQVIICYPATATKIKAVLPFMQPPRITIKQ
jgi:hypothetical protein